MSFTSDEELLQALKGMSNLCRQARAINVGSNLENAGMLRSLLGQLMPLFNTVRLFCESPWAAALGIDNADASDEVLDSYRWEVMNVVDASVSALKEKLRLFQKRVMRKTITPIKPSPPISNTAGQCSAHASPQISPALPRFRADLDSSQYSLILPAFQPRSPAEKVPSS